MKVEWQDVGEIEYKPRWKIIIWVIEYQNDFEYQYYQ